MIDHVISLIEDSDIQKDRPVSIIPKQKAEIPLAFRNLIKQTCVCDYVERDCKCFKPQLSMCQLLKL